MEHRKLNEIKGRFCSYSQCSCGKGLLKLGRQTFRLHAAVAADLLEAFSRWEGPLGTGQRVFPDQALLGQKSPWIPGTEGVGSHPEFRAN